MLAIGSSGSQVLALQKQLKAAGLDPGTLDGQFGANTRAAVEQFQRSHGLAVDGVAGTKTMQALQADTFAPVFSSRPGATVSKPKVQTARFVLLSDMKAPERERVLAAIRSEHATKKADITLGSSTVSLQLADELHQSGVKYAATFGLWHEGKGAGEGRLVGANGKPIMGADGKPMLSVDDEKKITAAAKKAGRPNLTGKLEFPFPQKGPTGQWTFDRATLAKWNSLTPTQQERQGEELGKRLRDELRAVSRGGGKVDSWELDELATYFKAKGGPSVGSMGNFLAGVMKGLDQGRPELGDKPMKGLVWVADNMMHEVGSKSPGIQRLWKQASESASKIIGEEYPVYGGNAAATAKRQEFMLNAFKNGMGAVGQTLAGKYVAGLHPGFTYDFPGYGGNLNHLSVGQADAWVKQYVQASQKNGITGFAMYDFGSMTPDRPGVTLTDAQKHEAAHEAHLIVREMLAGLKG